MEHGKIYQKLIHSQRLILIQHAKHSKLNQTQILFQRLIHCLTSIHQIVFVCKNINILKVRLASKKDENQKYKIRVLPHISFSDLHSSNYANYRGLCKEKVLVQSAEDFNITRHHFTDCPHIWPPGLSHIPRSHSRPLIHFQKEDNTFCTCPDFVYAFSCDLKVGVALRSYGLETVCK